MRCPFPQVTAAENETGRDEGTTVPALGCASVATVMLTRDTRTPGSSHSGGQRTKADALPAAPAPQPRTKWPAAGSQGSSRTKSTPRVAVGLTLHHTRDPERAFCACSPAHSYQVDRRLHTPQLPRSEINSRSHRRRCHQARATTARCRPRPPPPFFRRSWLGEWVAWRGGEHPGLRPMGKRPAAEKQACGLPGSSLPPRLPAPEKNEAQSRKVRF